MKVRINIYAIVKNLICMMISFELLELRIVVFLLSYLYCQNYVSHWLKFLFLCDEWMISNKCDDNYSLNPKLIYTWETSQQIFVRFFNKYILFYFFK